MENRYLFRGKRINNGEWLEGYCVKGLDMYDKEIHIIFELATIFYSSGETDGFVEVDSSTICQCTGLKNKNGNLIWENDIVKDDVICGIVKWDDENAKYFIDTKEYGYQDYYGWWKGVEVIGNKFDNPELLE